MRSLGDENRREHRSYYTILKGFIMATAAAKKAVTTVELSDIADIQIDGTKDAIVKALNVLETQIDQMREKGNAKGREIMDGFTDNKTINDMAAGMAEIVYAATVVSMTPMTVMYGAAKGVWDKIKD
jgi:3-oxoacyl-(acyl-carrier-protein) synthase